MNPKNPSLYSTLNEFCESDICPWDTCIHSVPECSHILYVILDFSLFMTGLPSCLSSKSMGCMFVWSLSGSFLGSFGCSSSMFFS